MEQVEVNKRYRHFKGHIIKVIAIGKHTENEEELVVYIHESSGKIWIRPLKMFLETEDIGNRPDNITGQKYRFELLEE